MAAPAKEVFRPAKEVLGIAALEAIGQYPIGLD